MADASVIELGVYLFVEMASILMLIISSIRDTPNTRASSIVRSIYLIPGMLCAGVVASIGPVITLPAISTLTRSINTTEVWTENATGVITLVNPVWGQVHWLFFAVLMVYVMTQMVSLFTKPE